MSLPVFITLTWSGWQPTIEGRASIEQWNVNYSDTRPTDTFSRKTLQARGYTVPPAPVPDPALQAVVR